MASILQKPDKGGQIQNLKLSTRRGALQNLEIFARCFTALADKRAAVSGLQAAWVAAAEADATRGTGRDGRVDDRATWDGATWRRYLAAASRHEPGFMPRIRRLLGEIATLEKLLALPSTPTRPDRLDRR